MNDADQRISQQIQQRLTTAVVKVFGAAHAGVDPLVRPAANSQFGDFQANLAMSLGRSLGQPPRDLAQQIVEALRGEPLFAQVSVAGPGFINLSLDEKALAAAAGAMAESPTLGVATAQPRRIVIDYGSPNLAKEMHIGHLRSTIIGDCLSRTLAFVGHRVIRQNHIGDWGTQFGMLLEYLLERAATGAAAAENIQDLNAFYQQAKKRDDSDPAFAERARQRVVALQAGDPASRQVWQQLIGESVRHMNEAFARLGILLRDDDIAAESFYNDQLATVCDTLENQGVARISDAALCVFVEGDDAPLIVRKSDGGYGYATTDLAAVRYRVGQLAADQLIYVVDARQRDHFRKLFAAVEQAGWVDDHHRLDHVAFGTILGADRRPFKTRDGGTVRLSDVLDEAVQRAGQVIANKNPRLPEATRQQVAKAVGIGSVKYADLSNDRIKDYVFDWERMLALEGNTAPYLLYSYARIRSIFRKGEIDFAEFAAGNIALAEPAERSLVLQLLQFADTVESVAESLEPHRLCNYLYELATRYHRFFEHCPVLKASDEQVRQGRLALSHLTARTLERGLGLLGIEVVEQM